MGWSENKLDDGRGLQLAGKFEESRQIYDAVLEREPDNHRALHLRGMLALQKGELSAAKKWINKALSFEPDDTNYRNALGQILFFEGDFNAAATAWQESLNADPNNGAAAYNFGTLALNRKQNADAEKWLRVAIEHGEGENWEAHNNLAHAMARLRKFGEADFHYKMATEILPDNAELLTSHADILNHLGELGAARGMLDRALELNPDFAPSYLNLANTLFAAGDVPAALDALTCAINIDPGLDAAHNKRLYFLHYIKDMSARDLFANHADWGTAFTARNGGTPQRPPSVCSGERQLRIGYVSSDFGWHSVGLFIHSIIRAHNRTQFHVTCYSGIENADSMTRTIKGHADAWRDTSEQNDDQLADDIRSDKIDILVDLSGHTGGNRLGVFVRRPARVQISYLGYPGTVGLPSIDFRIADEWTEPKGDADTQSVEKIIRIPDGFHCFSGQAENPPVRPPPVITNKFITFGSFNNIAKINEDVVALWSEILARVPNSRLLLKDQRFRIPEVRQRMERAFAKHGTAGDRLVLKGAEAEQNDHLALYGEVDIALDPFPYNGVTTTCEALWMGVPVVTLVGARPDARMGLSLLSQMGLSEMIAEAPANYIAIATGLAADIEKLADLRAGMRNRLQNSSLGTVNVFVDKLEAAYLQAWSDTT